MQKNIKLILFVVLFISLSVPFTSCGGDEPDEPQIEKPDQNPDTPNIPDTPSDEDENEQIPGSKILGTWYYLSPNNALKATVTFSIEKSYNFSIFGTRVCYISIESELPYYVEDIENVWSYSDSKWEITRFPIVPGCMGATISKVFDNELWMDLDFINYSQRIKFTRNDPGNAVKPSGLQVAPDGIFERYLWHGYIGNYNITFQFKGASWFHETSDVDVMVKGTDGTHRWLKENDCYGGYSNGYFHFECTGILCSVFDCSTLVVIKQTDKKLLLYNPFTPARTFYITRE
ncbi:MAG: hypothetical protein ACI4AM_06590 [Muribaculaceae bacterium]